MNKFEKSKHGIPQNQKLTNTQIWKMLKYETKIIKKNVNRYSKCIGLETIFKNILRKNDKIINFVNNFLYFLSKWYKLLGHMCFTC